MAYGPRTITHAAVTAAATTTTALAASTTRRWALFVNDSDEAIYLMVGAAAVLNQGIRLNANGGVFEMSPNNGNLDLSVVNCISTSGGKTLLVSST